MLCETELGLHAHLRAAGTNVVSSGSTNGTEDAEVEVHKEWASEMDLRHGFESASRNAKACGRKLVSAGCERPVEIEDARAVEA